MPADNQDKLSGEELNTLVRSLSKLQAGFLPYDVFIQVARLVALPIIEFVPLRHHEGQVEVLLLERGPDDPIWPNTLHTPGTVIRATDTEKKIYLAFRRILVDELKGTEVSNPQYVGSILHKSRRGAEHAQIYWVEVTGLPKAGQFYPVDALPDNLIQSQLRFILEAVRSYQEAV